MSELFLPPLARHLAWALVHFLWQGALLGLLAWGAFVLVRRQRPQVRYGVACLFLLACLLLPIVTLFWQSDTPTWHDLRESQTFTYRLILGMQHALLAWLPAILVLWGVGAGWFALRALGSWFWLHRLRTSAMAVLDSHNQSALARLRKSLGISRVVRLLESARVHSPFTTGLIRPVILVPLGFFTSINPLAAEAVLAHELAHIRRLDVVVIGLQAVIETLLFYHPVTWWISRRVATEREHCCDDAAVQACGDAVLFAQTLHRLEIMREAIPALAPGAGGGDLMERIKRLLNIDPRPVRITAPLLSMTAALAATALLAGQQPVRDLVRALPEKIASVGAHLLAGEEEVKGALLALERPLAEAPSTRASAQPQYAESALQPLQVSEITRVENQVPVSTSDSVATEVPLVKSPAQEASKISLARLGIPFTMLADAPIDPWPEGKSILEAESLPDQNVDLEDSLGRSDLRGPYSYTTWPFASSYTKRLIRLTVPSRTKVGLTVVGTSKSRKDGLFSIELLRLSTLIWDEVARITPEQPTNQMGFINHLEEPQDFVVVLTGPTKTSYRSEVTFSPAGGSDPSIATDATFPLEVWPMGQTAQESSAGSASMMGRSNRSFSQPRLEWKGTGLNTTTNGGNGSSSRRSRALLHYTTISYLRCLALEIQPLESFRFTTNQDRSVQMEATTPSAQIDAPWQQAILQANAPPAKQRAQELKVHNPTGKPQTFVLVLYQTGPSAKPYRIDLERAKR